jgi:hypothetical protein
MKLVSPEILFERKLPGWGNIKEEEEEEAEEEEEEESGGHVKG